MAPYNHESPPKIQLRLEEELNVPAMLNTNFIIKDKKDILRLEFCREYLRVFGGFNSNKNLHFQLVYS